MRALDWRLTMKQDVMRIGTKEIVTKLWMEIDIAIRDILDLKVPVFKLPNDRFITYDQLDGYWAGFPIVGERLPNIMERIEIYPFVGEWGTMFFAKLEARSIGGNQFLAISGNIINPSDRLKMIARQHQNEKS